jgi:pyruvate ferredoxin oxidoreductase beta subunit
MAAKLTLKTLPDQEFVAPGRSGCDGCAAVIAARMASKVFGPNTIMANATGCMCVNYGYAGAPRFPYIHTLFENSASVLAGIDAGLRALNKRDGMTLVGFSGDGGTVDIGLQALSGAVDRGHRFVYICYDNEGYMNTGNQRSGATPLGANTSTSPVAERSFGETGSLLRRKNMVLIMAAHGIPYAATASIAYPQDLCAKMEKAMQVDGPAYIHVLAPCSTSWGFPADQTIRMAKLAVETRISPLFEVTRGKKISLDRHKSKGIPILEYVTLQSRFRHLEKPEHKDVLDQLQTEVDLYWQYLESLAGD